MAASRRRSTDRAVSTGGTLLIVFIGLYLALGGLYTATTNTIERVDAARESDRDSTTAIAAANITIESAVWNASWLESETNLTVEGLNDGDRSIRVSEIDTVVDGRHLSLDAYERVEVDGRQTDLWRPGERLVLRDEDTIDDRGGAPARIKIVSGSGVADAVEVVGQ